jgi:polyferredoxin
MYDWMLIRAGFRRRGVKADPPARGLSMKRKVLYWLFWLLLMSVLLFSVTSAALSHRVY